jgi:PAS domain S-box-containing protein
MDINKVSAPVYNQLDRFFELSLDMMCVACTDGYFKRVNPAFTQVLGWSGEEMLARPFLDFVHPDDYAATLQEVERQLAYGEKVMNFENRYRHKDGSYRVFSWVSVLGDDGLIYATARDITESRKVEVQMQRSIRELADFKAALDAHAIVATTDAQGSISYVNDKFCAISQYSREELLGQNHRIINSGSHPQSFFNELWQTIRSGKIWQGEIKNRSKDGAFYWVNTTIVPFFDEHGVPVQYIAIRTDITAQKQAEQKLVIARDEAELANHAKDSFLATMSHEIRTPLGGLMGMLELLGFTPLNDDQRETMQAAMDSGQSLLRIVNDILDWSKIEAGKLELAPQATSLAQLVSGVVNTYARVASARSLILEQYTDVRLSAAHLVDPLRLSQVLNNFVSNALKFTPRGRIEVRAELLERQGGVETVRFSVKDTGIGIAKEVQQRLFLNYSQGSADTARM